MARFFINRPIVAMVISILMVIVGLVAMTVGAAMNAVYHIGYIRALVGKVRFHRDRESD